MYVTILFFFLIASNIFVYLSCKNYFFKSHFLPALSFKLLSGVLLGFIYLYYYQGIGDTFSIFEDAVTLHNLGKMDLQLYLQFLFQTDFSILDTFSLQLSHHNTRTLMTTKIISIVCFFSQQNYWVTGLFFSNICFWATWSFARFLVSLGCEKIPIVVVFFYFPSFVFWSSGILKETMVMPLVFYIIYYFLSFHFRLKKYSYFEQAIRFLLFLVSSFFLFSLKYYYFAVLLPFLIAFVSIDKIYRYLPYKNGVLVGIIFVFLLMAFFLFFSFSHENLYISNILDIIVLNYTTLSQHTSKQENLIIFENLSPHISSFFYYLPKSFFEGFFRPYFFEQGNILKKISGIENVIFSFLCIISLIKIRISKSDVKRKLGIVAVLFSCFMVCLLAFAAPNLGTLVRYKIIATPFMFLVVFSIFFDIFFNKTVSKKYKKMS